MQAVLERVERTDDGFIIEAVSLPWLALMKKLAMDPAFIHQLTPEQLEELIAASYDRAGYHTTLTPRSGDKGRDVIAEKRGIGAIRIIEQVKRYRPGHRVTADEVRALHGVLTLDQSASKGIVTTTSDFAPG